MAIALGNKRALYKHELMILEMLAECNWTRPIYVAITVGSDNYINLDDNFIQEGLANRITPFKTANNPDMNFDVDKVYKNVMERFRYGGLNTKEMYVDETLMRMCFTHRRLMATLASRLCAKGDTVRAAKVLDYADKMIPEMNVPIDYASGSFEMASSYYNTHQPKKAQHILEGLVKNSTQYLNWYLSLPDNRFRQTERECNYQMYSIQQCCILEGKIDPQLAEKWMKTLNELATRYNNRGGQFMGR